MPSIVTTSAPFACATNTMQDFTDLPSQSTVQAPQWPVSQPICGPVSASCSRRKWISSMRGSASSSTALPLTRHLDVLFAICLLSLKPRASRARSIARRTITPATLVRYCAGPRPSADGLRDRLGCGDCGVERRLVERTADQGPGRRLGEQRRVGDVGQRHRRAGAAAAVAW